ncbi:hypothetical protein GYH30_030304 [Glycine max]|nr:hypothetical protein GYH30_030304 [Glycine max]
MCNIRNQDWKMNLRTSSDKDRFPTQVHHEKTKNQ